MTAVVYHPDQVPGMTRTKSRHARRMTQADVDQVTAMLDDGASYHEVERTTGWSRSTLIHRFPGRGWPMSRGAEQRVLNEQLRKLGALL